MRELDPGYRVEIDSVDEDTWHSLLSSFDDATLYQTWPYGKMKAGVKNLSHMLLWYRNEIVSMTQVRITTVLGLSIGLAYVHWGPMWIKKCAGPNTDHLSNMLRAMRVEYAMRRKYMLRVLPKIVDKRIREEVQSVFKQESYAWSSDPEQTVIIDVSIPPEDLRHNFQKDWRRDLRNAEKQDLRIIEGKDSELLIAALKLVKEMKVRKKYYGSDHTELLGLQKELPDEFKMWMTVAEYRGEPVAALGWQTIGKIGFPVVAATGDKGLKMRASFLLWWKMINFYHERGFLWLDVGGVNADRNPGGYLFKSRLAGKNFKAPDQYVGQFVVCERRLTTLLFKMAYFFRQAYRHIRIKLVVILRVRSKTGSS
jgi:hypothetical protein